MKNDKAREDMDNRELSSKDSLPCRFIDTELSEKPFTRWRDDFVRYMSHTTLARLAVIMAAADEV